MSPRLHRTPSSACPYDYDGAAKTWLEACTVCGTSAAHARPVQTGDRYGLDVPFVECPRCGLRYQQPTLTAAARARFYREAYRPLVSWFHDRPITAETVQTEQRRYAGDVVDQLAPYLTDDHRTLLDLGGSTGVVAEAFTPALRALVVDPCAEELAHAAARGLDVLCAPVEELELYPASVDVILCCQMIDHLVDPRAMLTAARGWIRPHGWLYVDALVTGVFKVDHPVIFTPRILDRLLRDTGWVRVDRRSRGTHVACICRPGSDSGPEGVESPLEAQPALAR